MVQTALFKAILKRAESVKDEFHCEHIEAAHIAVAVADFCANQYTGLTPAKLQHSTRFEEERLRYLFSKKIKLASYLRLSLSRNTKDGVTEGAFDLTSCEKIANLRGANLLTADILFLCSLKELKPPYALAIKDIVSEDSILAALEDADKNVYDFVIDNIDKLCLELRKKANEAKALRDWKPAAKFAQPEDLLKQFLGNIITNYENNTLDIIIPEFLCGADLHLSIYRVNDSFVIHDNGCSVENLSKRTDRMKQQKVLDLIWGKSNLQDNKLFTKFTNASSVLYFIQEVILTANADLYYEYFQDELLGHRCYIEPCALLERQQEAKEFDVNTLLNSLKETIVAYYDENKGLTLGFDTKYCHCSYGIKVLIETLNDKTLRFSDAYKNKQYETGEMLEAFYFGSDDQNKDMYYERMQELGKPFGMEFDMSSDIIFPEYSGHVHNHKNPYMISTVDNWIPNFYKFINSAVLISVLVDRINFKKLREW
ncbi:MAG: hypothetical protein IKJ16_01730 [Agathobacter sp.]|nr:hypothetical protein [Agathobacter sp.]